MNDTTVGRIEWLRARIAALDDERGRLAAELAALTVLPPAPLPAGPVPAVTYASAPEEKIGLFLSLFRGRADVFPKRWENAKAGKAGYSPACANECRSSADRHRPRRESGGGPRPVRPGA